MRNERRFHKTRVRYETIFVIRVDSALSLMKLYSTLI